MICSGKPCTANTCCKASIVITVLLVLISITSGYFENASTYLLKNGATLDALTQPHTLPLNPHLLDHTDENEKFSYHNRF